MTFNNDPRVQKGIALILEALSEHKIDGIKPPTTDYKELCDRLGTIRGFPLYYPYIGSGFGTGPYVELADGSVKLDMISGIGVHLFGHNHPGITKVLLESALSDTVMEGNLMQNLDALQLSEKLQALSGLDHCFLTTSGAMACENALKILFQRYAPASRVLAFNHCFIGRTLSLSQITDKAAYRQGLPNLLQVDYLPFFDHKRSIESTQETLEALEIITARYPGQHACLVFELIQGEGGILEGSSDYFEKVVSFLRSKNIGVYVDEVQTFGRTESLFAHHLYGLKDKVDVVTIGKISQVCATLYKKELVAKPGLLSQTFIGSTSAIRAAIWFLENLESLYGKNGKIATLTTAFHEALNELNKRIPGCAQGPYGRGALIAFTPFDWDLPKVIKFLKRLFHNGVIAFQAGSHPARVRLLPPMAVVEQKHIDEMIEVLEKTIREEM